ncbi:MAG: response regulator [bacterium]|nr:response regulator [bacterium]
MNTKSTDPVNNNRPLIVVVDGSPDEMCLISESLKNSGYRVLGYADPEKGYSRIMQEHPALAIIDSHIAYKGGVDLIDKIGDEESLEGMPVIAVVTGAGEADSVGARADVFLARPFDSETLLQTVNGLI